MPQGYGVSEHTKFFFPEDVEYSIKISEICFVDAELSSTNTLTPKLYGSDGNILYANASVDVLDENNEYTVDLADCVISHDQTARIIVYGNEYIVEKTLTYAYRDEIDRENYLYRNGLETQEEYAANLNQILSNRESARYETQENYFGFLPEMLLSGDAPDSVGCCIEDVAPSYAVDSNSATSDPGINYNDSVSNEKFTVRYDTSKVNEKVAKELLNTLMDVQKFYCTQLGFPIPESYVSSDSTYVVYISDIKNNGETYHNSDKKSYIIISTTVAKNIYNGFDEYQGTVAHEYMHAIMDAYGIYSRQKTNGRWFHESFASWGALSFTSSYASLRTSSVKLYFSTPWITLTHFAESGDLAGRSYGTCVFPLYIYKNMGGASTIKYIYNACASSSNALDGVVSGLKKAGYSLADAFSGSTAANWSIYETPAYSSWGQPTHGKISSYPAYSGQETLEPLGCTYTRFTVPRGQTARLAVTIEFNWPETSAVRTLRTTASESNEPGSGNISGGRCTVVCNNLDGNAKSEFVVITINTSTSHSSTYMATASIS